MYSLLHRMSLSLSCGKLITPKAVILRRLSFLGKIKGQPILLDKTNHKVIYEFKYIVFPAGILKTRYLLPVISVPVISASLYFNQIAVAASVTFACLFQTLIVIGVSRLANNMVGKIYVNKKGKIDNVIISSINSSGSRVDESFSPDQLILSEFPLTRFLGFLNVGTQSSNKNYKINVSSVQIHDMQALKSILNDIVHYINVKKSLKNK